jgi:hypothetical protein
METTLCHFLFVSFSFSVIKRIFPSPCLLQALMVQDVFCSFETSLGRSHKKSDVLTCAEEQIMLLNDNETLNCPLGLKFLFLYFCIHNFVIRVGKEMQNVDDYDFFVQEDECS